MLDADVNDQSAESKADLSIDNFREQKNQRGSTHVIRKFINSAIYVEKPIADTISNEDISVSQKYSHEELIEVQNATTKRCTCSVDQKTCPCHKNNFLPAVVAPESQKSGVLNKISEHNRMKVSHSSLLTNDSDKDLVMKNWLAKKEEEKKKKEMKERLLMETKVKDKEALLEQERNNFKTWLKNKKKQEMEAKKKKQKELEEQELKELEKEKRTLENKLNYQLWLKKKEEEQLEKKIKQQLELINELEKKEQQLRENEKAFNEWLKDSKNKQKPIPLNKGLQSLCSSPSITYMNPNPWNPEP